MHAGVATRRHMGATDPSPADTRSTPSNPSNPPPCRIPRHTSGPTQQQLAPPNPCSSTPEGGKCTDGLGVRMGMELALLQRRRASIAPHSAAGGCRPLRPVGTPHPHSPPTHTPLGTACKLTPTKQFYHTTPSTRPLGSLGQARGCLEWGLGLPRTPVTRWHPSPFTSFTLDYSCQFVVARSLSTMKP